MGAGFERPNRFPFLDAALSFEPGRHRPGISSTAGTFRLEPAPVGRHHARREHAIRALLSPLVDQLRGAGGLRVGSDRPGKVLIAGVGTYGLARELGTSSWRRPCWWARSTCWRGPTDLLASVAARDGLCPLPGAVVGIDAMPSSRPSGLDRRRRASHRLDHPGRPPRDRGPLCVGDRCLRRRVAYWVPERLPLRVAGLWLGGLAAGGRSGRCFDLPLLLEALAASVTLGYREVPASAPPVASLLQFAMPRLFGNAEPPPLYGWPFGYFGLPAVVLAFVALYRAAGQSRGAGHGGDGARDAHGRFPVFRPSTG